LADTLYIYPNKTKKKTFEDYHEEFSKINADDAGTTDKLAGIKKNMAENGKSKDQII
jgi:hypothetical protein